MSAPCEPHVPSPCVGVCVMDPATGWCRGCLRTIEEITAWSRCSDAEKLNIWTELQRRALSASQGSS